MDKDEALIEFLNGLRIVLSNASAYQKDHPYFIKSVQDFKLKVDALLAYLSPIKIDIAPESIFMDGKYWKKQTVHIELANLFHIRKIKSIQFSAGITNEELVDFLSSVALPVREILKQGGPQVILRNKKNPHISLEELDYSGFLHGEGEEVKDAWALLFKEAIEEKDLSKINEFANNFEKIIKKFKVKDFSENEELRENLYNFLSYLKATQKDKFCDCARVIFNQLLKDKEALYDERLNKIKSLFINLDNNDYACMFWDGVLEDDAFDALNLNLFSQLVGEERQKEIVSTLMNRAPDKESLRNNPTAVKKIQDLLTLSSTQLVSDVYKNILSTLFKDISFEKGLSFDRNLLNINYRFILLNMLAQERHKKRLVLILERLAKTWDEIAKEKDFKYVKSLLEILEQRKKENAGFISLCAELDEHISRFIESNVWEAEASSDFVDLVEKVEKSALGADFYLHKIFVEGKVNPYGLKLFFKFFPEKLDLFCKNLAEKRSDIEFQAKVVEAIGKIDSPNTLEILKRIYNPAIRVIKIEILKAMQHLSKIDEEFLYSILKGRDAPLKSEAMAVLSKDPRTRRRAIDIFSSIISPWGTKNKIILENIMIIEEFELKDASFYLTELSKKPFFWNRSTRFKALEVLRRWH